MKRQPSRSKPPQLVILSEAPEGREVEGEAALANAMISEVEADTGRRTSARAAALRALTLRRLTEAQLRERLLRKGFDADAVEEAVAACKSFGYLDDRLFAQLYVDGRRKAVGDARLVAELVKRGIDRDAAIESVARAAHDEDERLTLALEKILRTRPDPSYPNCARALERLGFPASAIYRHLRTRATEEFAAHPDVSG